MEVEIIDWKSFVESVCVLVDLLIDIMLQGAIWL